MSNDYDPDNFGLNLDLPLNYKQKPSVRPLNPDLPQPPFVLTVCAPRGAGKSHLTRHLLTSKDFYKGVWKKEYIWCFSPTLEFNDDYEGIEMNRVSKHMEDDVLSIIREMEDLVKSVRQKKTPQVLFIFDDILDSNLLNFKGILDKIAARGRHIHISMIILSQRISGVSRTIRLNSDCFIVFAPSNMTESEQFLLQFVPKKYKKQMEERLIDIFQIPYVFICVNNQKRNIMERLRIGFSNVIEYKN